MKTLPHQAGNGRRPEGIAAKVARTASRMRADMPLVVLDALLVFGVYFAALVLRFDGSVPKHNWETFPPFVMLALVLQVGCNWAWGLYGQMWRHASVAEARRVLLAVLTVTVVLLAVWGDTRRRVPLSVILFGGAGSVMLLGAVRFHSRLFAFRRSVDRGFRMRVAVVGAGNAGGAIVREMLRDPSSGLEPVVVLDDNPRAQGRSLAGVPVLGGIDDLADQARQQGVSQVVLAITEAGPDLVQRVTDQARKAGVAVKIVPPVKELLGGRVSVRDVRDLRVEDLLGRQQVETDLAEVHKLLADRVVLITGAGGSIGSEIARQVASCGPARLILVDHDETHLHDVAAQLDLECHQALLDIRDQRLVRELVGRERPDVIFHAAAHKHVPLLERHPAEAVRTNVVGTRNLVAAAAAFGVERFVFISTDKAVQPSSVMGASKRMGEQIVAAMAPPGGRYCSVRFGNVLGSRGSVIPTFARQIAAGGPVTVTDPRMTRFFMSVHEAVQLVLQAAAFAEGGEVFMLEMGEPVNILELAKLMIHLSGRNLGTEIAVRITGTRPGEKLEEELQAPGEVAFPTEHPSIVRLQPLPAREAMVDAAVNLLHSLAMEGADAEAGRVLLHLANQRDGGTLDLTTYERSDQWSRSIT